MAALTFKKATSCYLSEWANLHDHALSLILDKLLEPIDHVRFSAVCKEWQSFTENYRQTRHCNRELLPWLMIPPPPPPELDDDSQEKTRRSQVYSIPEAKVYNNIDLLFPYYTRRCCGSSYGWLATVDQSLAITLHSPFRKAAVPIRLPPLDAVTVPIEHAWLYEYYVLKVVLSDDPALNPDDYAIVVLCDNVTKLAFIKRGQTRWTYFTNMQDLFLTDVIFYKDQIYAVGKWGDMVWLDFNNSQLKTLLPSVNITEYNADSAYLVESTKGDLLHVRRVRFFGRPTHGRKTHTTEIFEVFKLVFNEEGEDRVEHVQLEDIGGESLFLGDNHSVSVLASNYPECLQPNSIYFTDDLTFFRALKPLSRGPCDELGIYNLKSKSATPYRSLSVNWQLRKPPAIWILPSIN